MRTHKINIDTEYLDAIMNGSLSFEVCKNTRGYQTGDELEITESGNLADDQHWAEISDCSRCVVPRKLAAEISFVYSGDPRHYGHGGLQPGWVVLGLRNIRIPVEIHRLAPIYADDIKLIGSTDDVVG